MRDDYLSPAWATHHTSLSAAIHKLIKRSRYGFERLTARQFDAPWRRSAPGQPVAAR